MTRSARHVAPTVMLLVLATSMLGCPKELPRDLPPDELYRLGVGYHQEGRWDKAIEALQRLLFQDPGHPKADSAQFLVADSYFEDEQYLTAASEFLRLAQNRPAGPMADDARYRACVSYTQLSPRPELDQKYTYEAINQCRSVRLLYPQSPYAEEAQARINELTNKLARKYYLTGRYYFERRAYDSAIIYFEHLLENYRDTEVEPAAMLRLYQSYQRVGYVQEANQIRARLLEEYPNSLEAQELESMATDGVG